MRTGVCDQLAFTAADCTTVFAVADSAMSQLRALDARAVTLIREAHAKLKAQGSGALLPPPPEQLVILQRQRDAVLNAVRESLSQKLSVNGI